MQEMKMGKQVIPGNMSSSVRFVLEISEVGDGSPFILSHDVIVICYWIIFTAVCQTISVFGVGTNIINVICFVKQGFKDSVNVSLLGKVTCQHYQN
jgi:hypothetical protein